MRTDTHLKGTVYEDAFNFFDSFVVTDFEIELARIKEIQDAWNALIDFEKEEYFKEKRLADEAIEKKWQEQKKEDIRIRKQVRENQDAKVGLAIEIAKEAFYFNYAFGGIIAIIIIGFIRGAFQHVAAAFDANYHLKRAEQQQQQQPKKPNENLSNDKKFKEEMNGIIAKRNR